MSIITFVNSNNEETGKTLSLVAIATHMAIEYNNKILVISTTNKDDKIKSCYFEDKQNKNVLKGIFGDNRITLDTETGIEGIAKMARSNKLTSDIITNYTKVVFKDRLEVLLSSKSSSEMIETGYINLITEANMYYDKIFVDLDNNISKETRDKIIEKSDIVVINSNQNYKSLQKIKEDKEKNRLLKSPKTLFLIGRYDKFSKYNSKNITRFLQERNQVLTIPYNTLFFEAAGEAGVPDLFLRIKKISDSDDKNAIFMQEVKRASDNIIYRIQELQM